MLRSKKDENKGSVLATQKIDITGKQEMKGKQRM